MFDLHCHSLFSDGELLPSELVRRLEVKGYQAVCITDHADESNFEFILTEMKKVVGPINAYSQTKLLLGIELTHVHPKRIADITRRSRMLGAQIVVCHGETIVEPVIPGTNMAAIEAEVDILAHPGFITVEEATLAKKKGVRLEISGRKGHSLTNGHVLNMARKTDALLVINSDAHAPDDFMDAKYARKVGMGAGMKVEEVEEIYQKNFQWLKGISREL